MEEQHLASEPDRHVAVVGGYCETSWVALLVQRMQARVFWQAAVVEH